MLPDLDRHFPRYTTHDPRVPVWCVTPETDGCIHRFFDTLPVSPSGRYLAVFRLPFEDRQPEPGEAGAVYVVDLATGETRRVAESRGWEPQTGANVNWGGSDEELFFNDADTDTWTPFAWKLNPLTGARERMEGTVYHASPDGRWLISADMTAMRRTQPGYGVRVPDARMGRSVEPSDTNGFFLTDTRSGKGRLFLSLREILERADPPVGMDRPEAQEIYGFHCKFNHRGDRLMLSLRWYPEQDPPRWNMFEHAFHDVRYAWVTARPDGSELACAVGPEHWWRGGHHATWMPDGENISMNLVPPEGGPIRFMRVRADGGDLRVLRDDLPGSGHPIVHPDGRHLLADTYASEPVAFGDGTIPLRWIDLQTGAESCLVRILTRTDSDDAVLRVDPHPVWDRSGRYVFFNAFAGGTRRVYVADLKEMLDEKMETPDSR